jgi:uncharacterized protein YcaQ
VIFSRVGPYDMAHLDTLLFRERKLFEYWAHCASIVLTEDFPIYHAFMSDYRRAHLPNFKPDPSKPARFITSTSAWTIRARKWIGHNDKLRRAILSRLKLEGALPARAFEEDGIGTKHWVSTGWTSGRNVSRMLDFLWLSGAIMVAGRDGLQKIWDLSLRVLPDWTPRDKWREREIVRHAAQRSSVRLALRPSADWIPFHSRALYRLARVLRDLQAEGKIERIEISDKGNTIPGNWFIHTEDFKTSTLSNGAWVPRTTLLSPLTILSAIARTKILFGFDYTIEIYTPKDKRKFGYYVLPILHGDQLIGRIDPIMDRTNNRLIVNSVYREQSALKSRAVGMAAMRAIESLAKFVGARDIVFKKKIPNGWR